MNSRRTSLLPCAVLVAALGLIPTAIAAAESEPYRLTISGAYQVDRLNSPLADSLHLTMTHANRAEVGFDFRILDVPVGKIEAPSLHVAGFVLTSERPVAI